VLIDVCSVRSTTTDRSLSDRNPRSESPCDALGWLSKLSNARSSSPSAASVLLAEWLAERKTKTGEGERALLVGRDGRRLSKRSVDDVVRGLGKDTGVTAWR
jgi:hypothetical protein